MTKEPITILYVEDNFENRVLVRRVLESEGYIMREASTAKMLLKK
jgi:CheY-like chemotaxis protein